MLIAEKVLADCKVALEFLEEETDPRKFRLFWLAAVSAVRSVGHVLNKVDAVAHPKLRSATNKSYARWKQEKEKNKIFWDFIEDERNMLLKEGEPGVYPGPVQIQVDADFVYQSDFDIYAPMLKGSYAGEDCRDVLQLAIDWWMIELDRIKQE